MNRITSCSGTRSASWPAIRRQLGMTVALLAAVAFCATRLLATTGSSNEITNIHVENVTPTTVDVVWDTIHPSTSQVIIARDNQDQPERWAPVVPDPNLVNHHRVTVDKLVPYYSVTGDGVYYYYVASIDVNNNMYTNPGPSDASGETNPPPFLTFTTLPTDTNSPISYSVSAYGPTNVFAGSDLYLQVVNILTAGPIGQLYIVNTGSNDEYHDGTVTDSNNNVVTSIQVHYQCLLLNNPLGIDTLDQDVGKPYNWCYGSPAQGANNDVSRQNIRLRVSPDTPPGVYTLTFTLSPDWTLLNEASAQYTFNVLPGPLFVSTPPNTFPAIPNQATWETQMTALGGRWCDAKQQGSRDYLNSIGSFLTDFSNFSDAWNYDGGRVYQQIDSYTTLHGAANHPRWQHCALTILDPYRQYIIANQTGLQSANEYPYGMAMNYWRTGEPTDLQALDLLDTNGPWVTQGGGFVDPFYVRENAYLIDVYLVSEMLGQPRSPVLARTVDRLIGQLDQVVNQKAEMHPFMAGLALEALVNWYEMNLVENTPDNRIPLVVKSTLDGLWRDWWLSDSYSLLFNRYNIPNLSAFNALNDLIAPAYAWYWSKTADDTYLNEGDLMFAHTFDDIDEYTATGKQFSQIYKWSFDYVGWRSGATLTSTVAVANNPYSGPYADTEPPIEMNVSVGNITSTSATITWNTYENSSSQIYYGITNVYKYSSPLYDAGNSMRSSMVTAHSVTITNLHPGTLYHFQARSRDAANNLAASADFTFTTGS
jgi:Purple acid Phosphatase, N-terminal domain